MKKVHAAIVFALFSYCAHAQECWKSVSAGGQHTIAIKHDGTLWAWGSNYHGQLGDNLFSPQAYEPKQIGTDTNWKFIVAGDRNSFAIKTDGTLWGWGDNEFGQVGDGTFLNNKPIPTKIGTATNWKSVATAPTFTAAIRTDGTLWTWGENGSLQLGYEELSVDPKQVGTATDWRAVSVGQNHTVALKNNNTLWAWGGNGAAQLGNGTPTVPLAPIQIGSNDWKTASAGNNFTMAIKLDGTLWGWGINSDGQLGIGNRNQKFAPVQVGNATWQSVYAGTDRTVAIKSNGTLWRWGRYFDSIFNPASYYSPTQFSTHSNWESVSLIATHAFAFQTDKTVWSWGEDSSGQLGEGYFRFRTVPEPFSVVTPAGDAVQTICASGGTVADLKATGTQLKWYGLSSGGVPLLPTIQLVDGQTYYASSTKHGCESLPRLAVTVAIDPNPPIAPTGPTEQKFCVASKVSDLVVTGTNIKWHTHPEGGNEIESSAWLSTGSYYASQTSRNCESPRLGVYVIVSTTPPPTGDAVQTRCPGSGLWTLNITGNNIKYYDSETSSVPLESWATMVDGASYFISQTLGGSESCGRLRIDVNLEPTPPPTGDAEQVICGVSVPVNSLRATGESIVWYDAPTGGNALHFANIVNGNFYYAEQTVYGCVSTSRLKVKAILHSTPKPEYTGFYTYCSGITLGELQLNGTAIKWYTSATGGTQLPSTTVVQHNVNYYASQTINGFESCVREGINLVITSITPPSLSATLYVCNSGTVADLHSQGADNTLRWYESAIDVNSLPPTTPVVNGKHYWATRTEGVAECESGRSETIVAINSTPTPAITGGGTIIACNDQLANLPVEGTNIKWYETAAATTTAPGYNPLVHGENYFATQTINGCESPRTEFIIDLPTLPPAPTSFAEPEWKSVSAGTGYVQSNIAIRKDGTLWGWGENRGQLGGGLTGNVVTWASPMSFETWKAVENGTTQTFAIKTDGTLWRWGKQTFFANDESTITEYKVPTKVGNDNTWAKLSAGNQFIIALKTNGSLWAWGDNYFGTQGDGTLLPNDAPKQVGSATDWVEISAGQDYVLAIKSDGTLWGWGSSSRVTRTAVFNDRVLVPMQIGTSNKWRKIGAGDYFWFGIQDDKTLWIGGNKYINTSGNSYMSIDPEKLNNDTDWQEVSVGAEHAMGIKTNGTLWAVYGKNEDGRLGYDRSVALLVPRQVGTDTDWKIVEPGSEQTVAMKNDGSLWTCGNNTDSKLAVHPKFWYSDPGDSYKDRLTPVRTALIDTDCNDLTVADLKAVGVNIQWDRYSDVPGLVPMTTPLVEGQKYWGTQTTAVCPSRQKFYYQVHIIPFPKPLGASGTQSAEAETQTFCPGATVANLVAFGADIKWYDEPTGGVQLLASSLLTNDKHYYASQTFNGCEGSERLEVVASVELPETPTGNLTQRFCSASTVNDLVAAGTNIKWYSSEAGVTPLPNSTVLADNTYYYASQTINGCESSARLAVLAYIGTPAPTGNSLQQVCYSTVADLVASGTSIKWYTTESGGSSLPTTISLVDGQHYYASQTLDGCESQSRFEVTVSVGTPAPTGSASQSFCLEASVAELVAMGNGINWYTTATDGSPLDEGATLEDGQIYYASQTLDGCESASRLAVTVAVGVASPTANSSQDFFCSASVADLTATGTMIKWYSTPTDETELPAETILENGFSYYASQTIDGCESPRVETVVSIGPLDTPEGDIEQQFCSEGKVLDLVASGLNIAWYDSESGGTALDANTALTDNIFYYAEQSNSECVSTTRLKVLVLINERPTPPTGPALQVVEEGKKISHLAITGENIKWYGSLEDAQQGVNAISLTLDLENETSYFATQTVSSCEGDPFEVQVVFEVTQGLEPDQWGVKIYPNPTANVFFINSEHRIDRVSLVNVVGRTLITKQVNSKNSEFDLSGFASGVYFAHVYLNDQYFVRKIIKD